MKKILMSLCFILIAINGFCAELSWDQNSDASDYKVYFRELNSDEYQELGSTFAQDQTTFQIPSMPKFNQDYELSVKAFNECGNSSDFSNSVIYNECKSKTVQDIQNLKINVTVTVTIE